MMNANITAITAVVKAAQCTVRGGAAIRYALYTLIGPDSFEDEEGDWSCNAKFDNSNVIVFTGSYDFMFFTITVNTVTGAIVYKAYNAETMETYFYTYKTNDDLSVVKISEMFIDCNGDYID